jgi:hypothetical protein
MTTQPPPALAQPRQAGRTRCYPRPQALTAAPTAFHVHRPTTPTRLVQRCPSRGTPPWPSDTTLDVLGSGRIVNDVVDHQLECQRGARSAGSMGPQTPSTAPPLGPHRQPTPDAPGRGNRRPRTPDSLPHVTPRLSGQGVSGSTPRFQHPAAAWEAAGHLPTVAQPKAVHECGDAPSHKVGWFRRRDGFPPDHQMPSAAVGEHCPVVSMPSQS